MNKYIKILLLLLFAFAHRGSANCLSAESLTAETACVGMNSSESESERTEGSFCMPSLFCSSVAELTSGFYSLQIPLARAQRIQTGVYLSSLRALLQLLSFRESSLTQHKERLFDSTVSCYCCPASEYYVFALRRILI